MLDLHPLCAREIPPIVWLAAERQSVGASAVLFLPFDLRGHGANLQLGKHWGKRHTEDVQPARKAAIWAYAAARDPRLTAPADVWALIVRPGHTQQDDDGVYLALKPARDQLCRSGLLPDDAPRWWAWRGVEWVRCDHLPRGRGWTVLVFRMREQ